MSSVIDLQQRQRIALVQDSLLRDLNNAQAAIQHHGGPMPETHFTLAAVSALAEFCAQRVNPAVLGQFDQAALLTDVFAQEMAKAMRAPVTLKKGDR